MKNTVIALSVSVFTLMSCNNSGGNKSVILNDSTNTEVSDNNGKIDSASSHSTEKTVDGNTTSREESVVYMGLDKSKAQVIFTDNPNEHTLTIKSNNKKFVLDKKDDKNGVTTYERSGIKAVVKGDSLNLIQGENIIPLVKWK